MAAVVPSTAAEPGLSVAATARRLGVAPATLRTWDRRYGIGPSQRTAGAHRRYTDEDIRVLELMLRHISAGMTPGDAARAAAAGAAPPPPQSRETRAPAARARTTAGDRAAPPAPDPNGIGPDAARRVLSQAGRTLDAGSAGEVVHRCLGSRGVVWTWDNVLVPVLQSVGERFGRTGEGVEVEHLLSGVIQRELSVRDRPDGSGINPRPVLLAAAEDDEHILPLHALAAALAERQIQTRTLGARVPVSALNSAIRTLNPSVVFVWAQTPHDLSVLDVLGADSAAPLIMAAGPGWRGSTGMPVCRPGDLTGAVCAAAAAARA